jgi:ubiquitin C-terminal hydrolase
MGLKNLGNTCFMNSGIQCLTSVQELTEYFLSGRYVKEINMANPLGTKGELSRSYGILIAKMWYDSESSTAPAALKRAIGRFQPMFSGY